MTSSPAGIDCPGTCSALFADGASVTLTAHDTPGSLFNSWSGDCTGISSCAVVMAADRAVTATFGTMYVLAGTINHSSDGAGGQVSSAPAGFQCSIQAQIANADACNAFFAPGTVVTLSATATTGSVFAWQGDCAGSGTGDCTLTMSANHSFGAMFGLLHDNWGSTAGTATNVGDLACNATLTETGTIDQVGQHDWFVFALPVACPSVFQPGLTADILFVATGTPVESGTVYYQSANDFAGQTAGAALLVPGNAGLYYVEVVNGLSAGDPRCSVGCGTGTWTVLIKTSQS